jgi:hypothetical protein
MSKRIPTGITREYLESVALPNHGGRYTPISHKSIIDKVHEELTKRGFNVESELYRASIGGNVANGMYILDQGTDPDMKMMFVWGNSYDKSMRFKCGIGVYIPKTGNYLFAGNISSYARKHTGKADEEAIQMIQTQLNMANVHYADLLASRDILINQTATTRTYSELVGRMFIEKEILNKEQVSAVRDRIINKVVLLDNLAWDNAWNFYNSVATALRMSHPKNWFENQADTHKFINSYFGLVSVTQMRLAEEIVQEPVHEEVQEPTNQLDIFDVIAEATRPVLTSPTDVIEDDLSLLIKEEIQEEVAEPAEEFFNFGGEELPTFELPEL